MDKDTWINISVCINVQIAAASSNTSTHIFCVILEVHGKERLCGTVMPDAMIGFLSLMLYHNT